MTTEQVGHVGEELSRDELERIIGYAADVLPAHFERFPASLGCDLAVAELKAAAGRTLADAERELLALYNRRYPGAALGSGHEGGH